ncbi:MAG: PAS domain S-box protein [Cyanobacteria bacterium Co-bin13]|nr:PAS domain S-box protein [Cyanobacteria bacterium Co-bin13]
MNYQQRLWPAPSIYRAAKAAAVFVVAVGCLVLIGWLLDINLFKTVLPGLVSMRPTTALGLMLAGTALLLLSEPTTPKRHQLGQIASLGVIAIGLTTLINYVSNWPLEINPLFFTHYVDFIPSAPVGHMSPLTAICFVLLGSALGISSTRRQWRSNQERWVEILALASSLIAAQVIVAYLYHVQPIIRFTEYPQMPLHGAISFLVLAAGIALAHPQRGFVGIMTANSAGGAVARRLLPAAIAVPLVLGGLRIITARMGLFEPDFGTSLLAVLHALIFSGIVAWNARQLHRIDLQRQAALSALAQANADLEERIEERTAQLQAANERLNLATDGAGMATWDINLQSGTALWSAHAFELLGYEPVASGEATWEMWQSRIHPDDRDRVLQGLRAAQQAHQLYYPEHRIIRADNGQLVWLRMFGRFLYSPEGQASRLVGIFFDDTEHKQTQEERDRFFTLSLDMLCIAGTDGYFKQINPAWEATLGYSQAELLAQPYLSLVHPDDRAETSAEAGSVSEGGASFRFENRYRCKNGSYRWLSWSSVLNAETDLIYAVARDITVQKQAEQQLAEQAATLQRQADLLNLAYEAIFVRSQQGTITYWNRGAEALYGWSQQEALGRDPHRLLQTQTLGSISSLNALVLEQEHWQGELKHTCKNGQQIIVESRQVLIRDEAGRPTGFLEVNRDVTKRKQIEQAQQQLATIVENSPDFVATADLDGQLRYLNPAGRALVGLEPTAPIHQLNGTDFHLPERKSFMENQLLATLLEQGVWQGETLLRHFQTGELISVYQTAFVNRDRKTGDPLSIATVIRDIRERKQAEANLRESERRFRTAILYAPLPMMLHAEDGEVVEVNHSWTELSGYAPEEIPTIADWTERAYGTRQEVVQADIEHLHHLDHRVSEGEYPIKTRSGETRIWDFYSAPLGHLSDGRSLVTSTAIDVTSRKQAETDLQRSLKDLADFKFALDQSSIVAMTDAEGIITYVNDKFCELSQYAREELIGQNHRIINSHYHPKEFFRQMWATIAVGQVWQGEIRNRAKDGTFYWVATTIVPLLNAQGRPYQYIAVRSDITTRKTAEAALQQLNITLEQRVAKRTAQLQESNRDLEAFSYTVAHDLRAPLRGIQGFAQALLEDYGNRLDETAQEYIESIFAGTDRMNQLVDDLLTYSRLSSEQIHLTTVSLASVVTAAQAQLAADLRQQQAQITIVQPLPSVIGQRPILVQIVVNLLSNAVKFVALSKQPQVRIWAEVLTEPAAGEASGPPSPPRVRLWVEDNGIGIEPEYQEQIFGVFERLHSREAYPGTGIGLAIVRKGAERLDGQVGVESAPGQGSRFWIELRGGQ